MKVRPRAVLSLEDAARTVRGLFPVEEV